MIEEKTKVTNRRQSEAELRALAEAPSHVYFIYSAGLVKIGFSTNWPARTDAVCQGCADHAELIMVMTGGRDLERGYHALFRDYHHQGEWFRCDGKVRDFLMHYAPEEGRDALILAEECHREGTMQ